MNPGKINTNDTSFNGRVFLEKYSYHAPKMKKMVSQLNSMKFVKNSNANIYISSRYGENIDVFARDKNSNNILIESITKETTVVHPDAIISATKRVIKKFENLPKTQLNENKPESFSKKIKKFFAILSDRIFGIMEYDK